MIAPTFDQGNDSLWFVIGVIALFLSTGADVLVTRTGIWYHGLTEGNSLFRKLLPLKLFKFMFNGAAGTFFVDLLVRWLIIIGFVKLTDHIGYATNADCWLPFGIAAYIAYVVVKNELLIRKLPVTKTIGQVS